MKQKICLVIGVAMALILTFGVAVEARNYDDNETAPFPCWQCDGTGQCSDCDSGRCRSCDGTGLIVTHDEFMDFGEYHEDERMTMCNECYGSGQCQKCYGSG